MNIPFKPHTPKNWLILRRQGAQGMSQEEFLELLTPEEKENKFFMNLCTNDETTYAGIIVFAQSYLNVTSDTVLEHLGPLTVDNAWQYNILDRVKTEELRPVVWNAEGWWLESTKRWDQMPYVSLKDKNKIVYTPSVDYGKADRQVMIKVGKYLNQNFGDKVGGDTIRYWANRHSELYGNHTLRFAVTADDIEWVYENGPESCMVMDREARYINSDVHPVRVYESPDIAVAYLLKPGNPNRVMSRTVINTVDKQWTAIYGDKHIMESILESQDYDQGSLDGCRLQIVNDSNGKELCPYLDGDATDADYYDDSNGTLWLMVTYEGEFTAQTTNGYLEHSEERFTCECCDNTYPIDDSTSTYTEEVVCINCRDEEYTYAYTETVYLSQDYVPNDDVVEVRTVRYDPEWWLRSAVEDSDKFVNHDDEWMTEEYYIENHLESELEEAA